MPLLLIGRARSIARVLHAGAGIRRYSGDYFANCKREETLRFVRLAECDILGRARFGAFRRTGIGERRHSQASIGCD
jgi:hypothetical protein